ncbi:MAG TPA: GNAT family N-acetyltransferase [Terracidiphilus sp.]|jgi:diamine N-acetyltransferase|nr:GNAT family N-acetyltransferase [Terracidiphilus sp.]
MTLRTAVPSDLPQIVAIERTPAALAFVGQWDEERHRRTLSDPDARYYVAESSNGTPTAYDILRGLAESSGSVELKRIVVNSPGHGLGRQVLAEILRIVFHDLRAHRLFLDVFDDNPRARHVYESLGFQYEGLMREAALRNGVFCSLHLMSILDRE